MFDIRESFLLDKVHDKFVCEDWEAVDLFLSEHKDVLDRLHHLTNLSEVLHVNYDSFEERLHVIINSDKESYDVNCHVYEHSDALALINVRLPFDGNIKI